MKVMITVAMLVLAAGCAGTADPTRYYVRAPPRASAAPRPAAVGQRELRVGIRSVELPRYVERPQIVTRASANRLEVSESQQWGAPLRHTVPVMLAENIAQLVPTDQVAVFPWGRGFVPDVQVIVEVSQFEGALGGEALLNARWRLVGRAAEESTTGVSRLSEPAGADYESLVAAHSRLIGALSRDIADALRRDVSASTR
jgi:uncharacterized lipoprotein YmbA